MPCSTKGCQGLPTFRYTWAGEDEAHCCNNCAAHLKKVAEAIEYHVQMIPLLEKEPIKSPPSLNKMNPQKWLNKHGHQVLSNIQENLEIVFEEPNPETWQQFWNTSEEYFWWDLVKASLFSISALTEHPNGKLIYYISGLLEQGEELPEENEKIIVTLTSLVFQKESASAWVKSVRLEK